MTKNSATVEQFMKWVGDAKVMIAINSYEVCEKIMGVAIPFAEVHYDKTRKRLLSHLRTKRHLHSKRTALSVLIKSAREIPVIPFA